MTAGNNEQVRAVIEAGLVEPLVGQLDDTDNTDPEARRQLALEVAWTLFNLTCGGDDDALAYFVEKSSELDTLVGTLFDAAWTNVRGKLASVVQKGCRNVLRWGEKTRANELRDGLPLSKTPVVQRLTDNGMRVKLVAFLSALADAGVVGVAQPVS